MAAPNIKYIKINELSKILGISAQTIRNHEKDGTFPKPSIISPKGYRLYSEEDVTKLQAYFLPSKKRNNP